MIGRILRNQHGGATVEFALLAPTFLMFLFLLFDGGRMIFAKQALNELASATSRCMATQQTGCGSTTLAQSWAVTRGLGRNALAISTSNVTISTTATCGGVSGMIQTTITMPWTAGAMGLLPGSVAPTSLSASACFPPIA